MKHKFLMTLILLVLSIAWITSAYALETKEIRETFSLKKDAKVYIETHKGSISVTTGFSYFSDSFSLDFSARIFCSLL